MLVKVIVVFARVMICMSAYFCTSSSSLKWMSHSFFSCSALSVFAFCFLVGMFVLGRFSHCLFLHLSPSDKMPFLFWCLSISLLCCCLGRGVSPYLVSLYMPLSVATSILFCHILVCCHTNTMESLHMHVWWCPVWHPHAIVTSPANNLVYMQALRSSLSGNQLSIAFAALGSVLYCTDLIVSHHSTHIASKLNLASRALALRFGRRPNRNESPNGRHCTSLDINTRRYFASYFNITGFSQGLLWHFSVTTDEAKGFRIASEKNIFASLAIWGCAIRFASHIAVASRNWGH